MKILTTSTDSQTIRVIPRSYPDDLTIKVRDDSTNEIVTYTLESNEWNYTDETWQALNVDWSTIGGYFEEEGYLVIENEYALIENRFYDLELINESGEVIYKDKIFCTNQLPSDYSVNNDGIYYEEVDENWNAYNRGWTADDNQYVEEESYDNDYIII